MGTVRPAAVAAEGWAWRHATRLKWALSDVSFRVDPGERVLLLGASGSGKSTLLHGLAGVLGGDDEGESRGALLVDGMPAADARGRAALVLQDPDSQAILARVGDDVAFGAENLGVPREEIWHRVRHALEAVGLDVSLDRSTSALSGGQKQRLALAGALAMQSGVLLLDEPTANLDPDGVREVRDAVERVLDATGATLAVVEHRLAAWLPIIDRVLVLGEGGVVADGPVDAVLGAHGQELAASGVWVPGIPPAHPPAPATRPGRILLRAAGLAVARVRDAPVAVGVEVEVRRGEVLGITGPNGAGKTTLGLTLAGLLPPHAGRVQASDDLARGAKGDPIRWSSRELLTRIGTVMQDPEHQLLATTVRAELEVGPRELRLGDREVGARVGELLERLRLDGVAEANPYTLSGGEKRRLTVAAALATRPAVLVLDEPTFGQDARTWAELVAIIAGLRDAGTAVVGVTHDLDVLEALGAREVRMGASV